MCYVGVVNVAAVGLLLCDEMALDGMWCTVALVDVV